MTRRSDPSDAVGRPFGVLWRMQGPKRAVSAKLRWRAAGHELVVAFDDDEADIIETQFDAVGTHALRQRADGLKAVLQQKGWTVASA
jgi:hypothetical protein